MYSKIWSMQYTLLFKIKDSNNVDTHQMKNYQSSLKFEIIDGAEKVENMQIQIYSAKCCLLFQKKVLVYKSYTQMALTFMQTIKVEKSFKEKEIGKKIAQSD